MDTRPDRLSRDQRLAAWAADGFFTVPGLVSPADVAAVEAEVIAAIRADPPDRHPTEIAYLSGPDYLIYPETEPSPSAVNPEDRISKVFNCHTCGMTRAIAERADITGIVTELIGPELDCFQSQFIFKNPGVIGQPWHQDSFYFPFDKEPQVGVWLALSRATLENGCLWVAPGSHQAGRIFKHIPDRRPAANRGYLEIVDQDTSNEVPALMAPGDVLFFHSYLMHQSRDNVATERRAAMVYHYAAAGTRLTKPEFAAALARVNRWVPVRRP
jgi:phytanoyl-CoA hydroxylase